MNFGSVDFDELLEGKGEFWDVSELIFVLLNSVSLYKKIRILGQKMCISLLFFWIYIFKLKMGKKKNQ